MTAEVGVGREVGVAAMKTGSGGEHAAQVIAAAGTREAVVELGVAVEGANTVAMRDKRKQRLEGTRHIPCQTPRFRSRYTRLPTVRSHTIMRWA